MANLESAYWFHRAAEELAFAETCTHPAAANAHHRLGVLYARRVAELRGQCHLAAIDANAPAAKPSVAVQRPAVMRSLAGTP